MTDLLGRKIDKRYRIDSLIGHGGMADVYRGTDILLERPVAIKILTDRSDAVLRRFLREAQSMALLNHPNIVSVYDAGQVAGVSYIVMEFVAGRTLAQIPSSELTLFRAIRYFIDLAEALAYAHEHGVIHRDVKPANIMVMDDGNVKVMDFGLSRRTSEMSTVTNAGEIVGTIAYLAPERFLGKTADARSDLYSVGVVMYEVFTGVVPFKSKDDDLVAVIFAHVNEAPVPPHTHNRAVPAQVDRIVLKLLAKEPEDRYQTARGLIADLQALIGVDPAARASAEPIPATSPGIVSATVSASPPAATSDATADATANAVRTALDRTFVHSTALNAAYSHTLAGMLAARKRDYPEGIRSYTAALREFVQGKNDIEHAKTALKFAAMILQKNAETERPIRREVDEAAELLSNALPSIRGRRMPQELEEAKRVLYALQNIGTRLR